MEGFITALGTLSTVTELVSRIHQIYEFLDILKDVHWIDLPTQDRILMVMKLQKIAINITITAVFEQIDLLIMDNSNPAIRGIDVSTSPRTFTELIAGLDNHIVWFQINADGIVLYGWRRCSYHYWLWDPVIGVTGSFQYSYILGVTCSILE